MKSVLCLVALATVVVAIGACSCVDIISVHEDVVASDASTDARAEAQVGQPASVWYLPEPVECPPGQILIGPDENAPICIPGWHVSRRDERGRWISSATLGPQCVPMPPETGAVLYRLDCNGSTSGSIRPCPARSQFSRSKESAHV